MIKEYIMENFAVIDIILLIVILLFTVRAALRGFIKEALSVAALVLGILGGFFFRQAGADFIKSKAPALRNMQVLAETLAFIAIFIVVFLTVTFIKKILKDIVDSLNLGGIDKFLGMIFGLIEGVTFTVFVLFIIHIQPIIPADNILGGSFFAGIFLPLLNETLPDFAGIVQNILRES
ncbi:MAG: CvpA family protein [Treponema sp.]|jgi:membrane protein required for colicin V production|nr:CvpA family protein [Treponema sp.]